MRSMASVLILAALSCGVSAQAASQSYWLLAKDEGGTWCGYRDSTAFKSDADSLQPLESARITYSSDTLTELTYQVAAESGDWIVSDTYTPSDTAILLRRANHWAQSNLQVVEDATIRHGKTAPFRIVSATTLEGKKAEAADTADIDLPGVPIWTSLSAIPFMTVVAEMRNRSIATLCKPVKTSTGQGISSQGGMSQ